MKIRVEGMGDIELLSADEHAAQTDRVVQAVARAQRDPKTVDIVSVVGSGDPASFNAARGFKAYTVPQGHFALVHRVAFAASNWLDGSGFYLFRNNVDLANVLDLYNNIGIVGGSSDFVHTFGKESAPMLRPGESLIVQTTVFTVADTLAVNFQIALYDVPPFS